MLHPAAEDCPGSESPWFVQFVIVSSSGQKAFAGHSSHVSPTRMYPSLQIHRPLLIAELAGQTHWLRLEAPGGDTVESGHGAMTPSWQ